MIVRLFSIKVFNNGLDYKRFSGDVVFSNCFKQFGKTKEIFG